MKSISAALVLLSGSIIFAAGSAVRHDDTQLFVMAVGAGIGLLGLASWFKAFTQIND